MSRKAKRAALVSLLSGIGTFVAVYDHETKDFGRRSPICMVHSDGSKPYNTRDSESLHRFVVSIWWRRADGAETEDYMDDLADTVIDTLKSSSAANLTRLRVVDEFSAMDYPIVDGVMYRRERIRVAA